MKKTILYLFAAAILFVFGFNITDSTHDNAIYVAINGNDQNDGTKSKPFRTLNKAASEARAGSIVYIKEGIYKERLVVRYSGTKLKPITFKAYNQDKVVLTGEDIKNVEGDTSLVNIDNKNYITISGLIIQDLTSNLMNETVIGMYVTGSSSHITLENNVVRRMETHAEDGNAHGIAIYGTGPMKDIDIINNTIEDLKLGWSESLVLNGNIDGFNVDNNVVRRNDNIGIDLIGHEGISNDTKADYVRNGIVKNNEVYEISSYGNSAYGEEYSAGGIYVDGGKNITIEKNTIYNCDIGIEATSEHAKQYADNIQITDNIVYNNHYTGISIGGYDENRGGTINSSITKNIIYRNDTKGLAGGQLLLQHDIKNNVIEKNILTAGPSRIFIANFFTTNHDNVLTRNVFHKEKGKTGLWVWRKEEFTSFQDFKLASTSNPQSSYLDPMFENETNYDFTLKKESPAKNIIEPELFIESLR
ncbi:right-handed parallel beta-helix repeat-containing protein [Gracilibacillus salinarum]|uniref:Right-handed parallel beta-helix repeat-containing protein n=1 Tax=Gracilibacillus salinarum TaxID=2932255 RepID=A0ABY4GLK8_9BACI|nr:right-handed parallel beta-helix repeat-containing protein [Gracilibacillus salinarum]UOQ84292.1 right-handed parallel beta-helix repeat-containing protein [Gracilibacillus salinarum]